MVITDKLIYLQFHKTGCSHIQRLLMQHVGGRVVGKHNWLDDYPTSKMVVGSVRNPWEWYVSMWAFGCMAKGALHRRLTTRRYWEPVYMTWDTWNHWRGRQAPRFGFGDMCHRLSHEIRGKRTDRWKAVYADAHDPAGFRAWLKMLLDPAARADISEGYEQCSLSRFGGLMTYRYAKFYLKNFFATPVFKGLNSLEALRDYERRHAIPGYMIRAESLESDLVDALRKAGYSLSREAIDAIHGAGRTNASTHAGADHYYDRETIDLVAVKERFVIEKHGYKPPAIQAAP